MKTRDNNKEDGPAVDKPPPVLFSNKSQWSHIFLSMMKRNYKFSPTLAGNHIRILVYTPQEFKPDRALLTIEGQIS